MYIRPRMERGPWPPWITSLAASLGILGLVALYLAALRYIRESSFPGNGYTADERDALYLVVHLALLFFALLLGFTIGRAANGKGLAWALVFGIVALVLMAGTIIGSRELACETGRNDLVRHWEC